MIYYFPSLILLHNNVSVIFRHLLVYIRCSIMHISVKEGTIFKVIKLMLMNKYIIIRNKLFPCTSLKTPNISVSSLCSNTWKQIYISKIGNDWWNPSADRRLRRMAEILKKKRIIKKVLIRECYQRRRMWPSHFDERKR